MTSRRDYYENSLPNSLPLTRERNGFRFNHPLCGALYFSAFVNRRMNFTHWGDEADSPSRLPSEGPLRRPSQRPTEAAAAEVGCRARGRGPQTPP